MTKGDAHMIDSGFIRFGAVSALVGVLLLASSPGVHASSAGVVKASPRVVAQMVKDMGSTQPAKCQGSDLARSDRSWGAFSLANPLPAGCSAYDGFSIVRKVRGTWAALPIGGTSVSCSGFRKSLKKAGARDSVYRDFKAAGYCQRN